jgi:hypothetical protein
MSDLPEPPRTPLRYPLPDSARDHGWKHLPPRNVKLPSPVFEPPFVPDRAPLVILTALFASANFAILPLMEAFNQSDWGAVWAFICAGLIAAQGGALPFYLVFGRGPFHSRLIVFWASATAFYMCWGAGALTHLALKIYQSNYDDQIRFVGLSLPLVALACQLPLWPLRLYFGWSLVKLDSKSAGDANRPLGIRDFLIGTAVVAVAIAVAREAPKRMGDDFWIGWIIFAASVAGTSLLSVVPAMLFMLRRQSFRRGAVMMFIYTVGAAVVTLVVSAVFDASVRRQLSSLRTILQFSGGLLAFLSFAAGLSGAMLAARSLGYRLTFARERKQ